MYIEKENMKVIADEVSTTTVQKLVGSETSCSNCHVFSVCDTFSAAETVLRVL